MDGNAGWRSANVTLVVYNADECQGDGDAGLMAPAAFRLTPGVQRCAPWVVQPCAQRSDALGPACGRGSITITVTMPQAAMGTLNVLVDWNQDGDWCDVASCGNTVVPEHWVQNLIVAPGNVVTPLLPLGPQQGYVWMRVTLTPGPLPVPWEGSGQFSVGETEDYLVLLDAPVGLESRHWGGVKALYR